MANIQWNQINPNFGSTAALTDAATKNISQAGTIFGEMRKQILEEEQRAVENEYKNKQLLENTRQFNEQLDFSKQKESTRMSEWDKEFNANQQYRNKQLALEGAKIAASRYNNALQAQRLQLEIENARRNSETYGNLANVTTNITANRKKLEDTINSLEQERNSTTDTNKLNSIDKQLEILRSERKQLTATAAHNDVMIKMAELGTPIPDTKSPFYVESNTEKERTKAAIDRSLKRSEKFDKAQLDAATAFRNMNLTPDQQEYAQNLFAVAQQRFPDLPVSVITNIISTLPTTNSWFDFDGKQEFKISDEEMDNFIKGIDNNNNSLYLKLATADMQRKKSKFK